MPYLIIGLYSTSQGHLKCYIPRSPQDGYIKSIFTVHVYNEAPDSGDLYSNQGHLPWNSTACFTAQYICRTIQRKDGNNIFFKMLAVYVL